jgi:hypothetical protein
MILVYFLYFSILDFQNFLDRYEKAQIEIFDIHNFFI